MPSFYTNYQTSAQRPAQDYQQSFSGGIERIPPNDLDQFSEFPDWLQDSPGYYDDPLNTALSGLSSLNGRGIDRDYGRLNDSIGSIGKQNAQAAARAYTLRQMNSGASGAGAGVVQGQAYLPFARQQAQNTASATSMKSDLASRRAGLSAQIASDISGNRARQQALMSQYATAMQGFAQSQREYGLRQAQFNADNAFRGAQLDLAYRQDERAQGASAGAGGGATQGTATGGNFTGGYIPNSGSIQKATLNGKELDSFYASYPSTWDARGGAPVAPEDYTGGASQFTQAQAAAAEVGFSLGKVAVGRAGIQKGDIGSKAYKRFKEANPYGTDEEYERVKQYYI